MARSLALLAAAAAASAVSAGQEPFPSCPLQPYCKVYAPFQTRPRVFPSCPTTSYRPTYGLFDLDDDGRDDRTITQRLFPIGPSPIPFFDITSFLTIAGLQQNILSLWGIGEALTVLAPTNSAIDDLEDDFPAFRAWLQGLPSCYAFNRVEYFLQLHTVPRYNVTCQDVTATRYFIDSEPALAQQEFLTFWRDLDTGRYYVGNSCKFKFAEESRVLSQYEGSNGWLFKINKVLTPSVNPRAIYPTKTLLDYLSKHPAKDLTVFYLLLIYTGLDIDIYTWGADYWTVFVPVNEAFYGINMAALFDLRRRELVREYVASHFLDGETYLYQGSLFDSIAAVGNVSMLTAAKTYLTFTGGQTKGCVGSLQLRYNAFNTSCNAQARTIFPWVDQELTNALVHKIDSFLTPPYIPAMNGGRMLSLDDAVDAAAALHLPPLEVRFDNEKTQRRWDANTEHIAARRAIVEAMYKRAGIDVSAIADPTVVHVAEEHPQMSVEEIKDLAAGLAAAEV